MFANNETGDLLPIKEIGELLKIFSCLSCWCCPGNWKGPNRKSWGDFLSASVLQIPRTKGVGFLYAAVPDFDNLLHGGDQEREVRWANTENLHFYCRDGNALQQLHFIKKEFQPGSRNSAKELMVWQPTTTTLMRGTIFHCLESWTFRCVKWHVYWWLDLAGISVSGVLLVPLVQFNPTMSLRRSMEKIAHA